MNDRYIWKKYFHLIWIKDNDKIMLFSTPGIQKCKVFFKYSQKPQSIANYSSKDCVFKAQTLLLMIFLF